MHPKIKEFWIKEGHTIHGGHAPMYIWELYIEVGPGISIIETVCHGNKYRFNKEWYSEEEMLKIVKMKAFL
jgi:hypothetical protein